MALNLYSIYDVKAENYCFPFVAATDGLASRQVTMSMQGRETSLYLCAEDYRVYCVGEFNEDTGFITGLDPLRFVVDVISLKSHVDALASSGAGFSRNGKLPVQRRIAEADDGALEGDL